MVIRTIPALPSRFPRSLMASPLDLVRETTAWVVSQASHVIINDDAITTEVEKMLQTPPITSKWGDYPTHFYRPGSDLMAQYIMVLDTLNFCFWPNNKIEYDNLAGPLKNIITADEHAFDADRLAKITTEQLTQWLGADFPLIDERVRLLREVGNGLQTHFDGKASELIKKANGSAAKLVELLTAYFPGFRDHSIYKGKQVFLYKRVQIFVGDVWGAYEGKGLGNFADIAELTMFPDYRVPQLLEHSGILRYSPELSRLLATHQELVPGSTQEVEIRAASVQAIERMRKALSDRGRNVLAIELDWMMWNEAEGDLGKLPAHHRCLTIYY